MNLTIASNGRPNAPPLRLCVRRSYSGDLPILKKEANRKKYLVSHNLPNLISIGIGRFAMKSVIEKCVLLPFALGLFSCAAQSTTPAQGVSSKGAVSTPALYILPRQSFSTRDIAKALDKLFAENDSGDNLILYVHGRSGGKLSEPAKSLKRVMPSLKDEYTAKVVMFYWPGSDEGGKLGFPENRARAATPDLKTTLMQFQEYKNAAILQ